MKPSTSASAVAIIALSFAAGATDAFAFLSLGGIFTANMTGNLILIGLFQRPTYLITVIGALTAIVVFVVALFIGFTTTKPDGTGMAYRRVFGLLAVTGVIQFAVALGWLVLPTRDDLWMQCIFIALSASAMAFQTVIAKRLFSATGLSTTYVTGSITSLIEDMVAKKSGAVQVIRAGSVLTLVAGAFAGAAIIFFVMPLGAVLPLVGVIVAVVALWQIGRGSASTPAVTAPTTAA